jgi:hypothetical protein
MTNKLKQLLTELNQLSLKLTELTKTNWQAGRSA